LVLGVVAIVTGLLSGPDALDLFDRVWPILTFVVAITVVAELAAKAGLFNYIAEHTTRWANGRTWLLWLMVVALALVSTIFLSLDTTAVLLTPVVVVMTRHVGLNPLPFALTTVWLANTGSMLLPVSNLTNLLAETRMSELAGRDLSPIEFAGLTWAPALVAVLVPVIAIAFIHRRTVHGRYRPEATSAVANPLAFRGSAITVVALLPALVSGLPVWIPAALAAGVLIVLFAFTNPQELRLGLVPWSLVLLAGVLFLAITAAHSLGLGRVLAEVSGSGDDPLSLLQLSLTAAVGANGIDNLPAYLALEPVGDSPIRLVALLIGVNAGPLITPWASLATLLWHQRLTNMGVTISWSRYALLGLVVAPITVMLATLVVHAG
jgi:Na+/H+ antiporter NhaD/arsenite permease-like protein